MAGSVMPSPQFQGLDDDGVALAAGLLYTFAAGSTTPLATYSESTLVTPNANPVVLNSAGRATVYLSAAAYKFVLKTSAGVTVFTQDNVIATTNGTDLTSLTARVATLETDSATLTGSETLTNKTLTAPIITNPTVTGPVPISITDATVTFGATHVGRVIVFSRAAGIVATLPAATGTGSRYEVVIGATFTGAASIKAASASDYMIGTATLFQDGGDTVVGFATANSGTVATESDTLTLYAASNTTGGIKGARIVLMDIATAVWAVTYVSDAGGTEATPFSAAV